MSKFIKQILIPHVDYQITTADPAVGIIYLKNNFLSGHVRLLGRGGGQYPYKYLEMIDKLFGAEKFTIEVCSGHEKKALWTVDMNPDNNPTYCTDGQVLSGIPNNFANRWRCDPPYNEKTAREMYGCEVPSLAKLLSAGARVVKRKSLLFLLCNQNRQMCPASLKRIGFIILTVVPLNEMRGLNIYVKL